MLWCRPEAAAIPAGTGCRLGGASMDAGVETLGAASHVLGGDESPTEGGLPHIRAFAQTLAQVAAAGRRRRRARNADAVHTRIRQYRNDTREVEPNGRDGAEGNLGQDCVHDVNSY